MAEGLTVESYLDTGDRADFGAGATVRLFPAFGAGPAPETALLWEARGAAPLVLTGARLEEARRAAMEAAPRRHSRTAHPPSQTDRANGARGAFLIRRA